MHWPFLSVCSFCAKKRYSDTSTSFAPTFLFTLFTTSHFSGVRRTLYMLEKVQPQSMNTTLCSPSSGSTALCRRKQ